MRSGFGWARGPGPHRRHRLRCDTAQPSRSYSSPPAVFRQQMLVAIMPVRPVWAAAEAPAQLEPASPLSPEAPLAEGPIIIDDVAQCGESKQQGPTMPATPLSSSQQRKKRLQGLEADAAADRQRARSRPRSLHRAPVAASRVGPYSTPWVPCTTEGHRKAPWEIQGDLHPHKYDP